jgi:hypothetical protein
MAKARRRYFNRFKKRTYHKKAFTLPVAVLAGFAVPLTHSYNAYKVGGLSKAGSTMAKVMTGYDMESNSFKFAELKAGLLPVVLGVLVHKFVGGKMGVNRSLSSAGIPLLRI